MDINYFNFHFYWILWNLYGINSQFIYSFLRNMMWRFWSIDENHDRLSFHSWNNAMPRQMRFFLQSVIELPPSCLLDKFLRDKNIFVWNMFWSESFYTQLMVSLWAVFAIWREFMVSIFHFCLPFHLTLSCPKVG